MAQITIHFDASSDLYQSGYDDGDAESFAEAYAAAILEIEEVTGLTIYLTTHEGRESSTDVGDGETVETLLWQTAHDSIVRGSDGEWLAVGLTPDEERACRRLAAVVRESEAVRTFVGE